MHTSFFDKTIQHNVRVGPHNVNASPSIGREYIFHTIPIDRGVIMGWDVCNDSG